MHPPFLNHLTNILTLWSMQNYVNRVKLASREACMCVRKTTKVDHGWNNVSRGKVGKGGRPKWCTLGSLNFIIYKQKKISLNPIGNTKSLFCLPIFCETTFIRYNFKYPTRGENHMDILDPIKSCCSHP